MSDHDHHPQLHVHVFFENDLRIHLDPPQDGLLQTINQKLDKIIMTQTEAVTALTGINTELVKVGTETATLVTNVADLTKALADAQAAGGNVTPELEAAINAVAAQTKTVDDLVPDPVATT